MFRAGKEGCNVRWDWGRAGDPCVCDGDGDVMGMQEAARRAADGEA